MKKTHKLYLLILTLSIGCSHKNSLSLSFFGDVKKSDFKIEMEVLGSDVPKKIIFDGINEYEIPNEYGENEWFFVYKDSMLAYFRHIKTNRNDTYDYKYSFKKEGSQIYVIVNIKGINKINSKKIKFSKSNIHRFTK